LKDICEQDRFYESIDRSMDNSHSRLRLFVGVEGEHWPDEAQAHAGSVGMAGVCFAVVADKRSERRRVFE
jgi:hypothetical protein